MNKKSSTRIITSSKKYEMFDSGRFNTNFPKDYNFLIGMCEGIKASKVSKINIEQNVSKINGMTIIPN
jgi:hypothetical protein